VAKDGTLASGDELLGINNVSVKGKTKVEVAKLIQAMRSLYIIINYMLKLVRENHWILR
jgi:hypothetical protein